MSGQTGVGHHEPAFSDDSRYAFFTNSRDGTISVIDVWTSEEAQRYPGGLLPRSPLRAIAGTGASQIRPSDIRKVWRGSAAAKAGAER